jgi:hypothetical protein
MLSVTICCATSASVPVYVRLTRMVWSMSRAPTERPSTVISSAVKSGLSRYPAQSSFQSPESTVAPAATTATDSRHSRAALIAGA